MINKFKLFTGETVDYSKGITFTDKVLGRDITYKTVEVELSDFKKAIKSIKHNGIREVPVNTIDDTIDLIIDYCIIKATVNNEYYLLLTFDSVDEQDYDLCYRLNNNEIKEYEALEQEQKECYCIKLLNGGLLNIE